MKVFSIDTYNRLPSIGDSAREFHDQLKASGLTLDNLLSDLASLFSEGESAGRYAVWLLHRHFRLGKNERMVEREGATEPTIDMSVHIIPGRWNEKGEALEYRYVDHLDEVPPPPSPEFIDSFNHIMTTKGINNLGVCYAPNTQEKQAVDGGYIFLEVTDQGERKHIMTTVKADELNLKSENVYGTSWVPARGRCGKESQHVVCSHVCIDGTHGWCL